MRQKQSLAARIARNEREICALQNQLWRAEQAAIGRKVRLQLECGVNKREYRLLHQRWAYVEIIKEKREAIESVIPLPELPDYEPPVYGKPLVLDKKGTHDEECLCRRCVFEFRRANR